MIALLIGHESVSRIFQPVLNVVSALLLSSGSDHHHGHSHGGHHPDGADDLDETRHIATKCGRVALEVFEDGVPPRFRIRGEDGFALSSGYLSVETERPDGVRQSFAFVDRDGS